MPTGSASLRVKPWKVGLSVKPNSRPLRPVTAVLPPVPPLATGRGVVKDKLPKLTLLDAPKFKLLRRVAPVSATGPLAEPTMMAPSVVKAIASKSPKLVVTTPLLVANEAEEPTKAEFSSLGILSPYKAIHRMSEVTPLVIVWKETTPPALSSNCKEPCGATGTPLVAKSTLAPPK